VVEHFLGKEEVKSSILFNGSFRTGRLEGDTGKAGFRKIESPLLKNTTKN
jgi:hypothetical protein